ncbi:hypothetical protein DR999_PMT05772 [Platysternon megacephalum]|uniref:Uncharacterized protein n=1 Tax=Platysternon megacephalum TaxID=55544 RepID=A0A4D9EPE6_9SAUR|nr:hypothetical protein DR999_PMT05772 [Platysternon megacephalum]
MVCQAGWVGRGLGARGKWMSLGENAKGWERGLGESGVVAAVPSHLSYPCTVQGEAPPCVGRGPKAHLLPSLLFLRRPQTLNSDQGCPHLVLSGAGGNWAPSPPGLFPSLALVKEPPG